MTNQTDMPNIFGQDEPPRCVICGSYEHLRSTKNGWVCESCILKDCEDKDYILDKLDPDYNPEREW